jgi:hypothetical protein
VTVADLIRESVWRRALERALFRVIDDPYTLTWFPVARTS